MPFFRGASALVIRCFKRVEWCADALTGAAGPVFVALAWILTGLGGLVFFDTIAREQSGWGTLLLLPFYVLVPLNLYGHYYLVTHVSPGFPQPKSDKDRRFLNYDTRSLLAPERWGWHSRGIPTPPPGPAGMKVRRCRKCEGPKPERSHHCSVCKRCILQMDHHCPWINACVGLHNQRHFVLFMAWLSLACWIVVALGLSHFLRSIDMRGPWPYYSPRVVFTLTWVLSVAIGIAVPVLGGWHMYMVAQGETSIEGHDNDYLSKKAKEEGLVYLNPYDLGKRRNLQLFFNVGPTGFPLATLLFPLLIPPASNGWTWQRRGFPDDDGAVRPSEGRSSEPGLQGDGPGGRYIMGGQEELTDDEDGGGGWYD